MTPLVKKEIRLLLPAWIGAMILAIVPAWIAGTVWNLNSEYQPGAGYIPPLSGIWLESVVPAIFALGILLLGLSPFGQEFSQGTFTVLLSQPADRSRVWWTKISLAGMAFLTVWLAGVVSVGSQFFLYDQLHPISRVLYSHFRPANYHVYFAGHYEPFLYAFGHIITYLTLAMFVMFSGGLWTTLLLRHVTNAFWFTLLTPLAIILGISSWLSDRVASDQSILRIIEIALTVYSVAGFSVAALLFRRSQDLQSAGGEVSFPTFKKFAGLGTTSISFRPRHWFTALLWKEFQLHQVNILIAALILLLQLSSILIRKIHPHFSNPDILMVLETIWLLWLLMPVLIGCAAIADERRLGIMETQLSLPVSRRMQLFIKFSVALVLSLFLGAGFPLLVHADISPVYLLLAIVTPLFFISFYASSMARTVLQAMGLAIVIGVALYFYQITTTITTVLEFFTHLRFGYGYPYGNYGFNLIRVFLGIPILLLTFTSLTFWNYKRLRQNNTLLLANFLTVVAVFAGIYLLTCAIYFRAWEYVTPTLPLRGPARLSSSSDVKLANSGGAIYAALPGGRLWVQTRFYRPLLNGFAVSSTAKSAFVPGTDWSEIAADNFQAVGIRSDGSLWSIQRIWNASRVSQSGPPILSQIGSETDWSQAAGGHLGFLLLKKDGSLWTWGTNGVDWTRDATRFQKSVTNKLTADLAMAPTPLSDATNCIQLFSTADSAYAMNNSGDVWSWIAWYGTNDVSQLALGFAPKGPWLSFEPGWNIGSYVGVKTDGTLWFRNDITLNGKDKTSTYQLGKAGQKWKAATFANWDGWNNIIAIGSDGTLWNCTDFNPIQLGTHSDWIALSPGGLALASDGSLWAWNQPGFIPWLAPSRKPTYMGNIFKGSAAVAANP